MDILYALERLRNELIVFDGRRIAGSLVLSASPHPAQRHHETHDMPRPKPRETRQKLRALAIFGTWFARRLAPWQSNSDGLGWSQVEMGSGARSLGSFIAYENTCSEKLCGRFAVVAQFEHTRPRNSVKQSTCWLYRKLQ